LDPLNANDPFTRFDTVFQQLASTLLASVSGAVSAEGVWGRFLMSGWSRPYNLYCKLPAAVFAILAPTAVVAGDRDQASVAIEARIAPRCQLSATDRGDGNDLRIDRAARFSLGFLLDCNTPFRIGMASANGGLRLEGAAAGNDAADGFARLKPYRLALRFDTDSQPNFDAGSCAASQILASSAACAFFAARPGEGISPGERVTAINQPGQIQIEWQAEDAGAEGIAARLAAGSFSDTITLVIGPRT
jgi:hypothetical protein